MLRMATRAVTVTDMGIKLGQPNRHNLGVSRSVTWPPDFDQARLCGRSLFAPCYDGIGMKSDRGEF